MTLFRAAFLAALAGVLGSAALAQEGESSASDGEPSIVVTQDRDPPTRSEVSRQARDISDIGSNVRTRPLPRIEDRLCPGVMGLRQAGAELMIDRIRWNAERLDLRLADETNCTPNLIVAFVEDGKAQLAELERERGWLFESLLLHERRELLAEEGPVRVWTTTALRTRDGAPAGPRDNRGTVPTVSMWMAHSRIYLPIREDITQIVVLFDKAGARGKTLIQLADYASMRGFARTRPAEGDAPLDTILALFDPGHEPPAGLTDFDQAYLRSLYEGIPNLPAAAKLQGVNRELGQVIDEQAERAE